MITDVSRSVQSGSRPGGNATQPLPRVAHAVARPFVVSQNAPALPAQHGARVHHQHQEHVERARLVLWLAVFTLLNAGDLVSTYVGLQSGMREGNPLMSGLLGNFGFAGLISYKLLVVLAVSVGVFALRTFSKTIATATIWVCNALVCAVVVMNVLQFVLR